MEQKNDYFSKLSVRDVIDSKLTKNLKILEKNSLKFFEAPPGWLNVDGTCVASVGKLLHVTNRKRHFLLKYIKFLLLKN